MKNFIYILTAFLIALLSACTNPVNPFVGGGRSPDIYPPTIDITSHTNNQLVKGVITLSGIAQDDLAVDRVELYHVSSTPDGMKDVLIKNTNVKNDVWSVAFNTEIYDDGPNLFKAKVIENDKAKKSSFKNITLNLDNYGPFIVINQPEENRAGNPIFSSFTAAILPVDYEENVLSYVEWEIVSDTNEKIILKGNLDLSDKNVNTNENFTMRIDPLPFLNNPDFIAGYYNFKVRGKNQNDKFSREWASKRIYIDFGDSIPKIFITTPTSKDKDLPTNTGSAITITGQVSDDEEVVLIEFEWGKYNGTMKKEEILPSSAESLTNVVISHQITGLDNGLYQIRGRVKDNTGTTSEWTDWYYFNSDSNFPSVEILSPSQGQWSNKDTEVKAAVSIGEGSVIKKVTAKIGRNGEWVSYPVTGNDRIADVSVTALASAFPSGGEVTVYIRGYKDDTNFSEASVLFNLDTVKPEINIINPADKAINLNRNIRVSGTASDMAGNSSISGIVKSVRISISGTNITDIPLNGSASWFYEFDSESLGIGLTGDDKRIISIKAEDYAGNINTRSIEVTINQLKDIPELKVTNLKNNDKKYGIFTLLGEAWDDDGINRVEVKINDREWQRVSGIVNFSANIDCTELDRGFHTIYYRAFDIFGKSSEYLPKDSSGHTVTGYPIIMKIEFEVDPDVPVVQFDLKINQAISKETLFTGKVTKSSAGTIDKVEIKISGTKLRTDWIKLDNSNLTNPGTQEVGFNYLIEEEKFGNGQVIVYVRAFDDLSRVGENEINLYMDSISPIGTLSQPVNNALITDHVMTIRGSVFDPEPSSGLSESNVKIYLKKSDDTTYIIDGVSKKIETSLTNFTYNWTIPSALADGVYDLYLTALDRALNPLKDEVKVSSVRLSRYRPIINITANGSPLNNNNYIKKDVTFAGTVQDNDGNDAVAGVKSISLYHSSTTAISGDPIAHKDFTGSSKEETFSFTVAMASTHRYLIFKAVDKAGGETIEVFDVNVDVTPPEIDFRYSSVGHTGSPVTLETATGYSDSFWIRLDAKDTTDGTIVAPMDGATIQAGVGTASDNNSINANRTLPVGAWLKLDLKGQTGPIYINYSLNDRAGNTTTSSLEINKASSIPQLTITALDNGWINNKNIPAESTNSGVVKYSLNYSGEINDMLLTSLSSGNINADLLDGSHTVTAVTTDSVSRNSYRMYSFILDTEAPVVSGFTVTEDTGAVLGRVDGTKLSGKVNFSANLTDNFRDILNPSDFIVKYSIKSGTVVKVSETETIGSVIVKNSDNSFTWEWVYDTQTYPGLVGENLAFEFTFTDKAGNNSTVDNTYSIVPYIRSIDEVTGKIAGVKKWDGSKWTNKNYDEAYSFRRGSGEITLRGFNLSDNPAVTFTGIITGSLTLGENTNNTLKLNLPVDIKKGELKVGVGTIDSNVKTIYVFHNYSADNYVSIADVDMVLKDDNNALVVFQKHNDGESATNNPQTMGGSGAYRFWETAEKTFFPVNFNRPDYITHAYNRMWFINIVKDPSPQATQRDGKYYLFFCDSEMNNNTKGLQLTGRTDGWVSTAATGYSTNFKTTGASWLSENWAMTIQSPTHDWNFNKTGRIVGSDEVYNNRWRMSVGNGWGGWDHKDWSVKEADLYAYKDNIHTVWYSELDNKTYYRMMANRTNNEDGGTSANGSLKYPTESYGVVLSNNGRSFPAITVGSNEFPVIALYNPVITKLEVHAGNAILGGGTFTKTDVDTGVFAYPKIAINSSGVHIFYQDVTNGTLKYAFATTVGGLAGADKIVIDDEGFPGTYNDIRLVDNKPIVTYIASGYLGTGNAVRIARYVGAGTTSADYLNKSNWEIITLPAQRNITDNKVRGYVVGTGDIAWHFGFAKSDRPEFFREKR